MNNERKIVAEFDWAEYVRLQDKAKTKCEVLKSARQLYHSYKKNPNSRNFKDIDAHIIYDNSLTEAISAVKEYLTFLKKAGLDMQFEHEQNLMNSILSEYERFTAKDNTLNQD